MILHHWLALATNIPFSIHHHANQYDGSA